MVSLLMRKLKLKKEEFWAGDTLWVSGTSGACDKQPSVAPTPASPGTRHYAKKKYRNTFSFSHQILDFNKESQVDAGFSIFLSSASPFLGEFFTKSYSCHLFLARGRAEAYTGAQNRAQGANILPSPSLPAKEKQKKRKAPLVLS